MAGRGVAAQAVAPRPAIVRIGLLGGDLTMMRKGLRFLILLVVALAFVPVKAYAWDFLPDGQMWSGDVGSNHCATVHAGEIYDAATYAVGSDPNKVSASVRVKLSDPRYGGRFYEYAQTFSKMESWDDYPEWLPAYVGVAQLISNGLIGDFNIYNSEASVSLFEGAMIDFRRVLAGEDLSGGGSGGSGGIVNVSDYVELSASYAYYTSNAGNYLSYNLAYNASIDSSGNVVVGSGEVRFTNAVQSPYYVSDARIYVSRSVLDHINDEYAGKQVYFFVFSLSGSDSHVLQVGYCVADSFSVSRTTSYNVLVRDAVYATNPTSFVGSSNCYHDSDGLFFVLGESLSSYDFPSPFYSRYASSFWEVVPPPTPDGDWPGPEAPVTPDPPEVPTPTAPTETPDPSPTAPTVVWPTVPTVVNPPEVTVEVTPSELDYTELLTRINDNLNSIDSYTQAINTSLNSLRTDVLEGFDDVVTSIRNVYRYLQHLNDVLEVHCKHIRDSIDENVYELELYLRDLLEWLTDQLSYNELYEYDDSAVTGLLYRILNKIPGGNGPVTYKPNPQSDEPGFFDWLSDLWHRFLIDLVSVLPDELGGLVNAFSQLTHYFPFSIPWDLFALFALFEHTPVTPVFDIPWGYGGESGDVQMIRIDLSAWDGVMAMIRPVFIVGFCFKLAMITKDLLSNFDINKGGI